MKKKVKAYTDDGYVIRPNKTALKREHQALQNWAKQFLAMKPEKLAKFMLPDDVQKSIALGRKLVGNAQDRHAKYVAKQLAELGLDTIEARAQQLQNQEALQQRFHSEAEQWCQRLLDAPEQTLSRFFEQFPWADRQQLRQLVRALQKSSKHDKIVEQLRDTIFHTLSQQTDWLNAL